MDNNDMDRVILYEEYRLIERTEPEVNGAWKGAHLLLFFLAFVFGSFCTFCFHLLMYLFDEKCVLFPKLMSITSLRQNLIYELIPEDKEVADMLPVDFLSTQWVEKSACLLPTYVPLVSGIFGLIWTTMFLMCSIGSRVLTGLQRPWRVIPPVFLFSLVMGGVCLYTSTVTHYGLQELCSKLSEITGSTTCTYTINVATLAYQRRIRGVYQATRLTIASAWLHTACWLLSALLSLARILLAVDFKLVRVSVQLRGNIDKMLERHERQIRTVSPEWAKRSPMSVHSSRSSIRIHFMKKQLVPHLVDKNKDGDLLYYSDLDYETSEPSLVPTERHKLEKLAACSTVPHGHQFIVKMIYNIVDTITDTTQALEHLQSSDLSSSSSSDFDSDAPPILRQFGQQRISSKLSLKQTELIENTTSVDLREAEEIAFEIKRQLQAKFHKEISELRVNKLRKKYVSESTLQISPEMQMILQKKEKYLDNDSDDSEPSTSKGKKRNLKSSLKHASVQTDETFKDKYLKVQIASRTDIFSYKSEDRDNQDSKESKQTQTNKEKQE